MGTRQVERDRFLERVTLYHDQTKHGTQSYARSLGRLDWATQPNPFRHYQGAPLLLLSQLVEGRFGRLAYDELFLNPPAPRTLNRESLSAFFFYSLALSAWKVSGQSRWALRVNPSSGNLHPTEAHLIAGPIEGFTDVSMIAHYDSYYHALEKRLELCPGEWNQLSGGLPEGSFVVGLTSIYWRESWKYGERAFRYCQHDIGHALGCLQIAASLLGWEVRSIDHLDSSQIETLLGVQDQDGPEKEHGACLLAIVPRASLPTSRAPVLQCSEGFFHTLVHREWAGRPNVLSQKHYEWPILSFVSEAIANFDWAPGLPLSPPNLAVSVLPSTMRMARPKTVSEVVRGRRSAVAMDGETSLAADEFYRLLWRLHPDLNADFFRGLPFECHTAMVLFVHRVAGVPPGLYLFCRSHDQGAKLEEVLRGEFEWTVPLGCPEELNLVLLKAGDFQECSRTVSCHQSIAADGAFAVALLAEFSGALKERGAGIYPRLFWEAGCAGQLIYLEAEAAGLSATGIGCYFDDAVHQLLGVEDHSWQCVYHFTLGGRIEDRRVQGLDAYSHLTPQVVAESTT